MNSKNETVLNAGYFHLKSENIGDGAHSVALKYQPDTAYLVPACADIDQNNCLLTALTGEPPYLLYKPDSKAKPLKVTPDPNGLPIKKITFHAEKTEFATLEYGLQRFSDQVGNVAIMIDDLGLPSGLSQQLNQLLPDNYREKLAEYGFTQPIFISERLSRNRGSSLSKGRKPTQSIDSDLILETDRASGRNYYLRANQASSLCANRVQWFCQRGWNDKSKQERKSGSSCLWSDYRW